MILNIIVSIALGALCILAGAIMLAVIMFIPGLVAAAKKTRVSLGIIGTATGLVVFNLYSGLLNLIAIPKPSAGWFIGIFVFIYLWNEFRQVATASTELRAGREAFFWGAIAASGLFVMQIYFL